VRGALGCLVAAALLVACSHAPTTLRVERFVESSANAAQFEAFDRTISDAALVSEIKDDLFDLPAAEQDVFCPIAWGLRYRLTFSGWMGTSTVAVLEGDGCRFAHLGLEVRATNESFWAKLAGALGLYTRGNDLFPLPRDMRR
jgi:hypothetical protein